MEVVDLNIEKDFSSLVLVEAKKLFAQKNQKYLTLSRMEKLVAWVAKDLGFGELTRGWYKFGLFAPAALNVATEYSRGNLQDFHIPSNQFNRISRGNFSYTQTQLRDSIIRLRKAFIQEEEEFYNWVYSRAPKKYKKFYFSKMQFEGHLRKFKNYFEYTQPMIREEYPAVIISITDMYTNIKHVTDEDAIDLFYDYMDLLEMVLLKLKNLDFKRTSEHVNLLNKIIETYKGKHGLLTLLVPFKQTLEGSNVEYWANWIDNEIAVSKSFLSAKIDYLYEEARSIGLILSIRELQEDSRSWERKELNRKSIREMLRG